MTLYLFLGFIFDFYCIFCFFQIKYVMLVFVSFSGLAERGGKRQRAQDSSGSGEDPPAERDQAGAAH